MPGVWATPDAEYMDAGLLTGEPCEIPCWQGITPGVSTREEALTILRNLPFVDASTIQDSRDEIGWGSSVEGWLGGAIRIGDDERVQAIYYGLDYELELRVLLSLRGDPVGFVFEPTTPPDGWGSGGHYFELFWPEDGFSAYVHTDIRDPRMLCKVSPFTPEMHVYAAFYFEPVSSVEEHAELTGRTWLQTLIEGNSYREWNGYQPIECEP